MSRPINLPAEEGQRRLASDQGKGETDAALVAQAKDDPTAFGVLYERYVGSVYNYLLYGTNIKEEAEDLTARTFHNALAALPRYCTQGTPFKSWLLHIAHNLLANWYRDRSRHKNVTLEVVDYWATGTEIDPFDSAVVAEEQRLVRGAVARLPRRRQQLVVLKYVEELSNAEIGAVLGCSEGAAKALLHRTLRTMRRELERQGHSGVRTESHGGSDAS